MSVSAVLNARLDWPGSSSLIPDVDSLCCQGVCTFHSHCLHQESLMPGLYLRGNEYMYSPLHSRGKDIGPTFSARQQKKNSLLVIVFKDILLYMQAVITVTNLMHLCFHSFRNCITHEQQSTYCYSAIKGCE